MATIAPRPHPSAASSADTEPPPGAGLRSPTLSTKEETVLSTRRLEPDSGRQYSIIRSLESEGQMVTQLPTSDIHLGLKGDSVDSPSLLMAR